MKCLFFTYNVIFTFVIIFTNCSKDEKNINGPTNSLNISVITNKIIYDVGDTVQISVKVTNNSEQSTTLNWGSGCQANYYIDSFNLQSIVVCTQVPIKLTLQPKESRTWNFSHPPYNSDISPISVGEHKVIGEVLGYGKSDTLHIQVK